MGEPASSLGKDDVQSEFLDQNSYQEMFHDSAFKLFFFSKFTESIYYNQIQGKDTGIFNKTAEFDAKDITGV